MYNFIFFERIKKISLIIFSLFLFISTLIVFLEPYRTDESYYIHSSKYNIESPAYFDPLLFFLKSWFKYSNSFENSLVLIRLFIFIIYLLMIYIIYKIAISITQSNKYLCTLMSITFCSWIAIHRGFEVRPEILANFTIAVVLYLAFSIINFKFIEKKIPTKFYYSYGLIFFLLFFITTFNFRYWLISFGLFYSLNGLIFLKFEATKNYKNLLYISALFVAINICIHYYELGLLDRITYATSWSSGVSTSLGISTSLNVYNRYFFSIPYNIRLYYGAIVILIYYFVSKGVLHLLGDKKYIEITIALMPLLCFYSFLFSFDAAPFRYVRTIEAMMLFSSMVILLSLDAIKLDFFFYQNRFLTMYLVAFIVILIAVIDLSPRYLYLMPGLRQYLAHDKTVYNELDQIIMPTSFYQSIMARRQFCSQFKENAIVISSPTSHPFCGHDLGSIYHFGFKPYEESKKYKLVDANYLPIIVDDKLISEIEKRGYECISISKFYARCIRSKEALQNQIQIK